MELRSGLVAPLLLFGETLRFANEVFILARHGVMDANANRLFESAALKASKMLFSANGPQG